MQNFGRTIRKFVILAVVLAFIVLTVSFLSNQDNYGYVFSKTVKGEIMEVERVNQATAIIAGSRPLPADHIFSFAVAIRQADGEIYTASSEDRQWAVARKGFCVEAEFYPYPPWDLQKRGTYRNARLTRLMDCKPGTAAAAQQPAAPQQAPVLQPPQVPPQPTPEAPPMPTATP